MSGGGERESGNLRGKKNKTKQRDKTVESNLKPQGPETSRATLNVTACVFTLHESTTTTYSSKNTTSPLSLEPKKKKKKMPVDPPFHSERRIQTVFLTQPQNPTTGWLRGDSTEDDRRQIEGWEKKKKAHIFSRRRAWESAPLHLCFSASGSQSPSRKGGQLYWALDGIRKAARCMRSKSELCLSGDGF